LEGRLEDAIKMKDELEKKLAAVAESDSQVKASKQQLEEQLKEFEDKNKQQIEENAALNEKIVALNVQLQETIVARQQIEQNFTQKSEQFSTSVSNFTIYNVCK